MNQRTSEEQNEYISKVPGSCHTSKEDHLEIASSKRDLQEVVTLVPPENVIDKLKN